jgi:hypothetical protein
LLVAKLKAARDRKIAQGIKCGAQDLCRAIPRAGRRSNPADKPSYSFSA